MKKSETEKRLRSRLEHNSEQFPMVRVLWADAFRLSSGWHDPETISNIAQNDDWIVADVGYLLYQCPDYIILAGKVNEDNLFGEVTKIPTTWCQIEKLGIVKPKRKKKK